MLAPYSFAGKILQNIYQLLSYISKLLTYNKFVEHVKYVKIRCGRSIVTLVLLHNQNKRVFKGEESP